MICPKCKSPLRDFQIEGVDLDYCGTCKGVWFDKEEFSYYAMLERDLPEFHAIYRQARRTDLQCPRCGDKMEEMRFSTQDNLLIDRCRKCHGLWFDGEELAKAKQISSRFREKDSKIHQVIELIAKEENIPAAYARKPLRPAVISGATLAFLALAFLLNTWTRPESSDSSASAPVCHACDGTGKRMKLCHSCYGSGKVIQAGLASMSKSLRCDECGGSGSLGRAQPGRCADCNGSGWTRVPERTCKKCRGRGQIKISKSEKAVCPECQGFGKIEEDLRVCHECFGTGEAEPELGKACGKCNGTGMLARVESGGGACSICGGTGVISTQECGACRGKGRT